MSEFDYEKSKDKQFVNPYNFIRTKKNTGFRSENADSTDASEKKYTGKLVCHMYTKTPLAIPDVERVVYKDEHPEFPFFTLDGAYFVPASSIRGCIRSVYETITDSCYSTMPKEAFISKRVEPAVSKAGILKRDENNKWRLFTAERVGVPRAENGFSTKINALGERVLCYASQEYQMGEEVSFIKENGKVASIKKAASSGNYLYVGEPFSNRKKNESIFIIGDEELGYGNPNTAEQELNQAMNALEYSVKEYRNTAINSHYNKKKDSEHHGYSSFERCRRAGLLPVWYRIKNGRLSLMMAEIGRSVLGETVNQKLGKYYEPCDCRSKLCPACSVFGTEKGDGLGSKIRFSDAKALGDVKSTRVALKELGSPRPGYEFFYLHQEGAEININGRKYYWHIPEAAKDVSVYKTDATNTKRNATMELLSNAEFRFEVYFDQINESQLNTLKWVLALGDNKKESKFCHKIGRGKPIGLGSVKIVIEEEYQRVFSVENGYENAPQEVAIVGEPKLMKADKVSDLLIVTNFEMMEGENVTYPYVEDKSGSKGGKLRLNDIANHQWFRYNKNRKNEKKYLVDISNGKDVASNYRFSVLEYVSTAKGNEHTKSSKVAPDKRKEQQSKAPQRKETGCVSGYNPKGNCALVKIGNKKVSVHFSNIPNCSMNNLKKILPEGTEVEVGYYGQEGNYPIWKVERINNGTK